MTTVGVYDSIGALDESSWARLSAGNEPDAERGYLIFRERLEAGEPVLVTASTSSGVVAAVHATTAVEGTALFSHPWKLLTDEQFLRITPQDDPRAEHRLLMGALGDGLPSPDEAAKWLATEVGDPLVVRTFDRSPIFTAAEASEVEREEAGRAVLAALQDQARGRRGGVVVFPYVEASDTWLQSLLRSAGFVEGSVTGASAMELGGYNSYPSFLRAQNAQTRRNYNTAAREATRAGLQVREVALADHVERIVDLETRTGARNGAAPNKDRLIAARRYLASVLPGAIRVAAAGRTESEIIACTVQLYGKHGCCTLGYGCDYGVTGTSVAYHHMVFGEPVEACIQAGVPRYRLGFEAFAPKYRRGARVTPRGFWLWMPDERRRERFGPLLRFLGRRTNAHLAPYLLQPNL